MARPSASWVIRHREGGRVIAETFSRKTVDALNTEKYEAVPILDYLMSLNAAVRRAAGGGAILQ